MNNDQRIKSKQIEFSKSLYSEHFEEASILYEQRHHLMLDSDLTWMDIEDFEDRIEAHLDALVVGENMAINVCKEGIYEGAFGEYYVAICLYCRQNCFDLVNDLIHSVNLEDTKTCQAVRDALCHELPTKWQHKFIQMLSKKDLKLNPIIYSVIAFQRWSAGNELIKIMQNNKDDLHCELISAAGRIQEKDARHILLDCLHHSNENICYHSAIALLRLGDYEKVIDVCLQYLPSYNWPLIPLALAGNQSVVSFLLNVQTPTADWLADWLLSLGLTGDISAVQKIFTFFSNSELVESAVQALNLITGAELYEKIFIPEEIDEDELFEDELELLKKGESITNADGTPMGNTITRLSQKIDDWKKWWASNELSFQPEIRYRNGKPFSPSCLLENMISEKYPQQIRQLAYEEFVIRYRVDYPFDTDMLVKDQKNAIALYSQWIKNNSNLY